MQLFPVKLEAVGVLLNWKGAPWNYRSSRPEVICEKSALRNYAKFTGKYLSRSAFFNKVIDVVLVFLLLTLGLQLY